jgi:amino acid permease
MKGGGTAAAGRRIVVKNVSKWILIAFVIATVIGSGLHFLYDLLPNGFTAVFSPVSESLWEHVKLIFWPFLAAAILLTRKGERGCRAPWLLSLLIICGLMLISGFLYHVLLSGDALIVDIAIYVICMAIGFILPGYLAGPLGCRFEELFSFLTAVLALLIVLFSFLPPDLILFQDLSSINTFNTIPY